MLYAEYREIPLYRVIKSSMRKRARSPALRRVIAKLRVISRYPHASRDISRILPPGLFCDNKLSPLFLTAGAYTRIIYKRAGLDT